MKNIKGSLSPNRTLTVTKYFNVLSERMAFSYVLIAICLLFSSAQINANPAGWVNRFDDLNSSLNFGNGYATSAYLDPAGNVGANMAWGESYMLDSYLNMYRLTGNVDYLNTFISQYKKIKDAYYVNGAWLPLESFKYSVSLARNGAVTESTGSLPTYWSLWGNTLASSAYYDPENGLIDPRTPSDVAGITVKTAPGNGWEVIETPLYNNSVIDNKNYEPGVRYNVSFYAKQAPGALARGRAMVFDYTTNTVLKDITVTGTSWKLYSGQFIAPATPGHDIYLRLYHTAHNVAATTHFDKIAVKQYTPYAVHDGNLAVPLLRFFSMVKNGEAPENFITVANEMAGFLTKSVLPRWQGYLATVSATESTYLMPDNGAFTTPRASLPNNMYLPLAEAQLYYRRGGGSIAYETAGKKLLNTFINKLNFSSTSGDAYDWNYNDYILPIDSTYSRGRAEDYSHANQDIRSMIMAYEYGYGLTRADMDRFSNTFTDVMWNGDLSNPTITKRVDGSDGVKPSYMNIVEYWVQLGQYKPLILNIIKNQFESEASSNASLQLKLLTVSQIALQIDALRGHWKMDKAAALDAMQTTDITGYANDAKLENTTNNPFIPVREGNAIKLDGVDDKINLGTDVSLQLDNKGTVSFWYKSNGWRSAYTDLLSRGVGAGWANSNEAYTVFNHHHSKMIYFSIGSGTGAYDHVGFSRPTDGGWHLYSFSFDGTNLKAYLDGVLKSTKSQRVTQLDITAQSTGIGQFATPNGAIDEVRIYGRALSSAEVYKIYERDRPLYGINDIPPTANPDTINVASSSAVTIDPLANDTGSGLILQTPNAWSLKGGKVALSANKLRYTPKAGFNGEDKIWYSIRDSQSQGSWSVIVINVTGNNASINAPPTSSPDNVTTTTATTTVIDVLANDSGENLTLDVPNAWSLKGGSVSLVNNKLVYKSKIGFTGNDNIWYTFRDSQGRSNSGQVNITVNAGTVLAPYPTAIADNFATARNTAKSLDILANDTGNGIAIDTLYAYSAKGGTTVRSNGKVQYTPKTNFTGEDNFWYVMIDSLGRKNSAQVKINVTP